MSVRMMSQWTEFRTLMIKPGLVLRMKAVSKTHLLKIFSFQIKNPLRFLNPIPLQNSRFWVRTALVVSARTTDSFCKIADDEQEDRQIDSYFELFLSSLDVASHLIPQSSQNQFGIGLLIYN